MASGISSFAKLRGFSGAEPLYALLHFDASIAIIRSSIAIFASYRFSFLLELTLEKLVIMSDYEDEMDVDTTASKGAMQFSSDNTAAKFKRAAADLPVEAQDNLPW